MRKEVKLGFAIGGVVLAVVLVWVLSLSGSKNKTVVASATNAKGADATSITPSDDSLNNEKPQIAESSTPAAAVQPTTAPAQATATADSRKPGDGTDWGKLLNGSQQIPLMTQTPSASPAKEAAPAAQSASEAPAVDPSPAADTNAEVASASSGSEIIPAAAPANDTQETATPAAQTTPTAKPLAAGPRSHQVQRGETLSSIAMAAYGSPNFYPAILRANPKLDPRRMKPGMTIVLPDVSEVKHDPAAPSARSASSETHSPSATVNTSREYKVQPGDSLYRISVKLYGNSSMQDKIYELNRTTIGPSKERVRAGMVLRLPSAPTATAAAH